MQNLTYQVLKLQEVADLCKSTKLLPASSYEQPEVAQIILYMQLSLKNRFHKQLELVN